MAPGTAHFQHFPPRKGVEAHLRLVSKSAWRALTLTRDHHLDGDQNRDQVRPTRVVLRGRGDVVNRPIRMIIPDEAQEMVTILE